VAAKDPARPERKVRRSIVVIAVALWNFQCYQKINAARQ
jgi:hypothetical protein